MRNGSSPSARCTSSSVPSLARLDAHRLLRIARLSTRRTSAPVPANRTEWSRMSGWRPEWCGNGCVEEDGEEVDGEAPRYLAQTGAEGWRAEADEQSSQVNGRNGGARLVPGRGACSSPPSASSASSSPSPSPSSTASSAVPASSSSATSPAAGSSSSSPSTLPGAACCSMWASKSKLGCCAAWALFLATRDEGGGAEVVLVRRRTRQTTRARATRAVGAVVRSRSLARVLHSGGGGRSAGAGCEVRVEADDAGGDETRDARRALCRRRVGQERRREGARPSPRLAVTARHASAPVEVEVPSDEDARRRGDGRRWSTFEFTVAALCAACDTAHWLTDARTHLSGGARTDEGDLST